MGGSGGRGAFSLAVLYIFTASIELAIEAGSGVSRIMSEEVRPTTETGDADLEGHAEEGTEDGGDALLSS